jgi:copper oxidase (laccase) domain-containing protein
VRGVQVVESTAFDKLRWLTHGFSTRPGGASRIQENPALNLGFTEWDDRERVAANRDKFVAAIGARKMSLITIRQFHSDAIQLAATPCAEAPSADALITNTPGLLLGVQTGDCRHIFLSPAAEWFEGPFAQLADGVDPLWLPWLTMMPPGHVPPPPRVQLDLRAANRWQLIDAGVPEKHIDVSDLCTACSADLLFSYRREGAKTGRMMAVIGIK